MAKTVNNAYGSIRFVSGGFRTGTSMRVTSTNVQTYAASSAYRNLHSDSQYLSYGQQGQPQVQTQAAANERSGSIPGPQGEEGPIGSQGPQGQAGPAGSPGPTGSAGPAGASGQDGVQGLTGDSGPSGVAGPEGVQGPAGINAEDADLINYRATIIGSKLYFDNVADIDISLIPGATYKFELDASSLGGTTFHFANCYDGENDVTCDNDYVTGVTTVGIAGNTGAYVKIDIKPDTPTLFPWVQEISNPAGAYSGYGGTSEFNLVGSVINEKGSYFEVNGPFKGDLIPYTHDTYDIGSAQNKIRDLYVEGGSSIWLGEVDKIVIEGYCSDPDWDTQIACIAIAGTCTETPPPGGGDGDVYQNKSVCENADGLWTPTNNWNYSQKAKRRRNNIVPATIVAASGDEAGALVSAGICSNGKDGFQTRDECHCGSGGAWDGSACTSGTLTVYTWTSALYLEDIKLYHWLRYLKQLGTGNETIQDVYPQFGTSGYEESDWEKSFDPADPTDRGRINAELYDKVRKSVVSIVSTFADYGSTMYQIAGSGWILEPNGIIVTNTHVVPQSYNDGSVDQALAEVYVAYHDPDSIDPSGAQQSVQVREAKVLYYDYKTDISMLEIQAPANTKQFPYLKIKDPTNIKVGEEIFACGHAFGSMTNSITKGILRDPKCEDKSFMTSAYTGDFETLSGMSGAPVVDGRGLVVGLHTWILEGGSVAPPNSQSQGISCSGGEAIAGGPSALLLKAILYNNTDNMVGNYNTAVIAGTVGYNIPLKVGFMGGKYNTVGLPEGVQLSKLMNYPLATNGIIGCRLYDIKAGSPLSAVTSGDQIELDDVIISVSTSQHKVGTHDWMNNLGLLITSELEANVFQLMFLDANDSWNVKICTITIGNFNSVLLPTEDNIRSSWS